MRRAPRSALLRAGLCLLLPAWLLAAGCGPDLEIGGGHGPVWERHGPGHADDHADDHAGPVPQPVHVPAAERWTEGVETVPVELDGEDFLVAARGPHLTQAPCTRCHGEGLPAATAPVPEKAHWDVRRPHGAAAGLTSASCHRRDDPAVLVGPSGREVGLDHAYRLCADCHFQQVEDWAGGAHGKQVGAWAGERVVESCAACHDPHDPGFPHRLPATFAPPPEGNDE